MPITPKVRDIMDHNVVLEDEDSSISEAIKKMLDSDVWSVLVVRKQLPVGVVTELDIVRRAISKGFDLEKIPVGEIMSSPPITF